MADSCIAQAAIGAAFGGLFGGLVGAATTTFMPNQSGMSARNALSYSAKSSARFGMVVATFSGVSCASQSLTQKKGPHNAVAAGITAGVVSALLTSNYKHGLAFGGMSAICMGALELAGGSLDSRGEKDIEKLAGIQLPK